jgi:hypothetical protein
VNASGIISSSDAYHRRKPTDILENALANWPSLLDPTGGYLDGDEPEFAGGRLKFLYIS